MGVASDSPAWPVGGGETGALIREHAGEWASSLGPTASWPSSLKLAIQLVLSSPTPQVLLWGSEGIVFYNDAMAVLIQGLHPRPFGRSYTEAWPERTALYTGVLKEVFAGRSVQFRDRVLLSTALTGEPLRVNLDFSPYYDEAGEVAGAWVVITDRRDMLRAQQAQLEAEQRLDLALSAARMASWFYDPQKDEFVASSTMTEVSGLLPGQSIRNAEEGLRLIHPDEMPTHRAALEELTRNCVPSQSTFLHSEYRIVRPIDGRIAWMELRSTATCDREGRVQMSGLVMDVTERKVAELAMRESERRLRSFVDNAAVGMAEAEVPSGKILWVNEATCRMSGYTAEELTGMTFMDLLVPEDRDTVFEEFVDNYMNRREHHFAEHQFVSKQGKVIWTRVSSSFIMGPDGFPERFAAVVEDITEQKLAQDALRAREEQYRLLVENARDYAIFTLDTEGRILTWNPGAERIYGHAAQDIIGRPHSELYTPEARATDVPIGELAIAAEEGQASDDLWQQRKDGSRLWASGVTAAIRDDHRSLRGFVKVLRDRTEPKLLEDQRLRFLEQEKRARREAERAMVIRDEFLAVVSHELRTPLSTIVLWSKLLRTGAISEKDRPRAVESIEKAAIAQQHLIEDLLDISRMMSGKLRLELREIDLLPVVRSTLETVRPMAAAKNIVVTQLLDARVGRVLADPDRLQQVLWNLLNNAVKFTGKGGRVSVGVHKKGGTVEISVTDTGRGIAPEFIPHVFERFRQADASTQRVQSGLGLGLAITRQLVELHGGNVRVESPGLGKGTTFTVELPLLAVEAVTEPPRQQRAPEPLAPGTEKPYQAAPPLRGLRVLLVEDDAPTREAVKWALEHGAAEVVAVESADRALHAFQDSLYGRRFDVVISDIGMPSKDGYALLAELRELEHAPSTTEAVPAVALTAFARSEDRQRALEAGFAEHVAKPIEPVQLIHLVREVAHRREVAQA